MAAAANPIQYKTIRIPMVTEITMWEIPNLKFIHDRLVESLECVIRAQGLSNLSNFRLMKSDDITTRAFFSQVNVTDNQRLIDILEGVPFLGYQVRIAAVSQTHATLRIPFPETRDQYTETDPNIAPQNLDMRVFIGDPRNHQNDVNN